MARHFINAKVLQRHIFVQITFISFKWMANGNSEFNPTFYGCHNVKIFSSYGLFFSLGASGCVL